MDCIVCGYSVQVEIRGGKTDIMYAQFSRMHLTLSKVDIHVHEGHFRYLNHGKTHEYINLSHGHSKNDETNVTHIGK